VSHEDTIHELREAADRLDLVAAGDGFVAAIMRACSDLIEAGTTFGRRSARHVLASLLDPMPIDGRTLLEYARDEANGRRYSDLNALAYSLAEDAIKGALDSI
jgi:hypothetical protein